MKKMLDEINFLYLNEQDMIDAGVKDMKSCIKSMEDMFMLIDKKDYRMGGEDANEHGIRVNFPKYSNIEGMPLHKPDYRFMAMPAYLGGRFHMFGIKSYGSNSNNSKINLPRSILMMSLLDPESGIPLAYMSANILSAMRTGAVVGVGAKYLAKKNPSVVAIVGPGTMSRYSLRAIIESYPSIKTIKIKGRGEKNINSFVEFCEMEFPQIASYEVCGTVQNVCCDADVIFYGTTNAAKYEDNPHIKRAWLKKGALVISVSALLVDDEIWKSQNIKYVADNYQMYEDWGKGTQTPTQKNVSTLLGMGFFDAVVEKKISKESITNIGEVIGGEKEGRDNEEQIIIYAVGGMPIEDVAWGYDIYKRALSDSIGNSLKLWNESQL